MPTFNGPWIDPGPVWVNVTVAGPHQVDRGKADATGNAAADEAAPQTTIASPPNALQARAVATGAPGWSYDQATARIAFNLSDLIYLPSIFPVGAVGAEIEPPRLGVFLGPTVAHLAAVSVATGSGTDMTATNWSVYDAEGWTRSSTLAALTARTTVNFTAMDIPVNLIGSDYTLTGSTDQHRAHSLLVVADRQVNLSHLTSPAGPTDTDTATVTIELVKVVVFAHPPRYRFIYNKPLPLRQFPRDDSLGGAPRQGQTNSATSVQGSARQGWRATYR